MFAGSGTLAPMPPVHLRLTLPQDPALLERLAAALESQSSPPISMRREATAVVRFEGATGDIMLRSRVVQALEVAVGEDWQAVVAPVG